MTEIMYNPVSSLASISARLVLGFAVLLGLLFAVAAVPLQRLEDLTVRTDIERIADLRQRYGDLFQQTVELIEIEGTAAARHHFEGRVRAMGSSFTPSHGSWCKPPASRARPSPMRKPVSRRIATRSRHGSGRACRDAVPPAPTFLCRANSTRLRIRA